MYIKHFLIISGLLENKQEAENMAVEDNKGGQKRTKIKGQKNRAEEENNQRTENLVVQEGSQEENSRELIL